MLRTLPLCTCCRHYPGAATGCIVYSLPQSYQPSPIWQSGRPAPRPFRGLFGVHLRYGLHTRAVTIFRDTLNQRLQLFRYLHSCSGCFRLEHFAGWAFHPLGKRRLFTAHAKSGNRDLAGRILAFIEYDQFITWAWDPGTRASGQRRTTPPLNTHDDFVQVVKRWISAGAPLSPSS